MGRERTLGLVRLIVTLLVSATFLLVGLSKIAGQEIWLQRFAHWGYPRSFVQAIGVAETLGAVLIWVPRLARPAALLLGTIMVGAGYTHVASREGWDLLRPLIYLVLLGIVVWLRRAEEEGEPAAMAPTVVTMEDGGMAPPDADRPIAAA